MKKINLRESLLKIDRSTDFKHALTDLYEACMLEDSDKKKLAQFIEDKDIPGMSAMLSNKAGIMSENVSDDLPDDEVPLVEGGELSLHGVANLEDIDYIMSYEMANCIVYEGDTSGEYKCAYHNGASVEVKFNPEAPGYVYTIDGEGPYETNSSETVQSDIIHALDRKCWKEAFPEGAPVDEGWNPNLTDCPCCGDISFDSIRGRCTQCSYVEDLTEGIFSIAGDAVGKGLGDLYKGVKNVAKGVRDVAVAGANDAKKAVTDIKQSKFADKVRDASRAIKNADTVDDFKSDYKRRQEMRQKSDTKRDQVWKDKRGNERIGKSIGNEQDWIYVVNGKKMNYDEYKKIPSAERSRLNNAGKVQKLDLSGKPITKSQNKKRLNAKVKESLLMEGPGAGYTIECDIVIDGFNGTPSIKRIELDKDPGATPGSYKVYLDCDGTGHVEGLEAHSYYYGDSFPGTYPVKISELLVSVSVVGDGDLREVVENSIDGIIADLVGFTFTSKYTYGGGWSHSTYDGTITDTTNPLNDSYWGEDDVISFEVYGMDARLTDNDIIDEIDMTVSGENEYEDVEESLTESIDVGSRVKQTWANPYNVGTVIDSRITPAEGLKLKVKWDYSDGEEVEWVNSDEVSPYNEEDEKAGFYESLTESTWDSSRVTELVKYYLDRSNVPDNMVVQLVMNQMKEEGKTLPYNITDFYDTVYSAIYKYNSGSIKEDWTHFTFKSGSNPYIAKDEKEKSRMLKKYGDKAKEVKSGFYEIDDTENDSTDLFKFDDELTSNESLETSKEWEHKDKDGKIGRIRQSDGRGDRKFLTRDQAKEIAKFRGHEDDELYPVNESESIKEASYGFKNGNRYYGGLPNDEDIFDSPQVYYPKEETKIADNNDPVAVRKLRRSIANPLYKLILDEVAPENQFDGDQVYVTTYPNSEEIYLVSEVLLDNDCPDKSTAMSNMKNYLNRIGISFNPQLIEVDIDSFDDGETYVYTAFPLSALSMKSNEALNKDLDKSKSINKIGDTSLTERVGTTHPEESKIADRLMSIPGTTKVEFDWANAEIYSVPENHLIMLVFCHDGFDEPYFENRRKWRASVLGKLRTMGWTLEDPVEDNDSYLYLVMQKRRAVTENVDTPKSGLTKYKVTWKIINADDSYVKESKEVFAKDEKSAKDTVKDKRARDIKAVKMTEAFKHPQFDGPWWYLCKHGIGPGALPKDVTVLETVEDETNPYRVYVALDKVLTTSELKQYEMKEARPPKLMRESKNREIDVKEVDYPVIGKRKYRVSYDGKNYTCILCPGQSAMNIVVEGDSNDPNPKIVRDANLAAKIMIACSNETFGRTEKPNRFRSVDGKVGAPKKMTESTNSSKLIRNAITELVKSGSSISDSDFVDDVMDYMEDAFGEHPSYREVLNTIRDFRSKERTNTLKSIDTSSRNTFQVGDEMTYSGLYGGETTIKVLGVNGSRMKAEISWPSMEDGSDLKDKKVFDIVLDDEGNDCIEVWHYRGETGRVYPPERDGNLKDDLYFSGRVVD